MRIDDVHAPQPPSTSPTGPAPHDEATALLRQVAPHATRGLTPEALATHLEDAQRRHGLPTTGEPDAATLEALRREASWIDHERAAHEAVTARWQDIRAGRTDLSEVADFADAIRGLDREALVRGTTVLDVDGGVGLLQLDPRACTQACALVIRAEADPVVAWELTSVMGQRGERPHASDAGVLETYARFTEGRWGAPQMGPSLRLYDQATNRGYVAQQADTPAGRARIAALLERGVDVYLGVRWEGGSGHATVLTDVRGEGARREVRLFDPSSGRSSWVSLAELGDFELNGSRARAGLFHDSARGRRDDVTWDPGAGRPVATDSLFERLR